MAETALNTRNGTFTILSTNVTSEYIQTFAKLPETGGRKCGNERASKNALQPFVKQANHALGVVFAVAQGLETESCTATG